MKWLRYVLFAVIVAFLFGLLIYIVIQYTNEPSPGEEWNRKEDNKRYDTDSLYEFTELLPLEQLLYNVHFLEQVKGNGLVYIYGYDKNNDYLASINYTTEQEAGYQVRITRLTTDECDFALFIPDVPEIATSKEMELAVELLSSGFPVVQQVEKLEWEHALFIYEIGGSEWEFVEAAGDDEIYLQVRDITRDERWRIRLNDFSHYLVFSEVFTNPEQPDVLTFIFYFENIESGEQINRKITLDLSQLSERNSDTGKYAEADRWLYGDFGFIYDQWAVNNKRGFVAISTEDPDNPKTENGFYDDVEQWVYLDYTGRMQWYGNSVGIFGMTMEPLDLAENSYHYELNLIENVEDGLQQIVLEVYDNALARQIKTKEFVWDRVAGKLLPIKMD